MSISLILRIGSTSSQDISLTSGGVTLLGYAMQSPDVDQAALANLGDGNGLSVPSWSNVTESLDLHISAATPALVAAKVSAIEKLLDLARQGTTGWLDDRLYLLAQFDQDAEPWRSQILAAKLELEAVTDQIWRKYVKATLIVTRRFYWETEAEKLLSMTSHFTPAATTAGVRVYNNDDDPAFYQNWFDIAAAAATGTIPAPLKLTVRNDSLAVRSARAFYFGNYVYNAPTTVDPILRVETTDTWTGTLGHTTHAIALSGGNLIDSFRGQFGRVLVTFSDMPEPTTLMRATLQIRFPSPEINIAIGEHVLAGSNRVLDLGGLPIPPGHWAGAGSKMYLTIQANAVNGDSVGIDWVQIMPSGAGRYRVVKAIVTSYGLAHGDSMVDDGTVGTAYSIEGGATIPVYRPFFEPLNVWPGKINRIRMLVQANLTVEANQPWMVSAAYHPRRLTL